MFNPSPRFWFTLYRTSPDFWLHPRFQPFSKQHIKGWFSLKSIHNYHPVKFGILKMTLFSGRQSHPLTFMKVKFQTIAPLHQASFLVSSIDWFWDQSYQFYFLWVFPRPNTQNKITATPDLFPGKGNFSILSPTAPG